MRNGASIAPGALSGTGRDAIEYLRVSPGRGLPVAGSSGNSLMPLQKLPSASQ